MSDEPEPQQSDEELAAAWGAETESTESAEGGETQAQPARVLNQAEIDSLLGFDDGPAGGENRTGMQKIISSGLVSYERLPMLEIVFDRLVRIMSTSLRNFTSDNVEVGIDNILSLRFGDYLNSIPLPAMLAVFKAEEWDNYGLMVVDSSAYGDLLEAGVHILELQNAVLHSKLAVVDGVWTAIGSSNLDRRSVVFNDEVDAIILGTDTAAHVEALLQRDAAASAAITLQAWQNRPIGERLNEFEARLWEYWM